MSAIDNLEIGAKRIDGQMDETDAKLANALHPTGSRIGGGKGESYQIRKPTKVLHFSDGVLEVEADDSDEPDDDDSHQRFRRATQPQLESAPPVDPKTLSWPSWFQHYTAVGGSRTLNVLDSMGESIAYYLGITTPKYQYEIDEYLRAKEEAEAKKKESDIELASWATPSNSPVETNPIIQQVFVSERLPASQTAVVSGPGAPQFPKYTRDRPLS